MVALGVSVRSKGICGSSRVHVFPYFVLVLKEQQLVEEGLSLDLMKENFDNKVSTYLQRVEIWAHGENKVLRGFL